MEDAKPEQVIDISAKFAILKRLEPLLVALLLIGILAFIAEAYFVSKVQYVGGGDGASFGIVADNLLKGRGFVTDFVNEYFIDNLLLSHPEEYGYPMVSIVIAPFVLLFGKTAIAVKMPSMLIMTIFLPLITFYLGKEIFNSRIGFLAGISMIFFQKTFASGFNGERDAILALFFLLTIFFFLRALKNENYFYPMGFFLGLSYLIRPSTIAFFPIMILAYYLMRKKFSDKFALGMAIGLLVIAPWLIRNYLAYGNLLLTATKDAYIMGYFPYFEPIHFSVYWGEAKPSFQWLADQIGIFNIYVKVIHALATQYRILFFPILLTFVGFAYSSGQEPSKRLLLRFGSLAIISAALIFPVLYLLETFFAGLSPIAARLVQVVYYHSIAIPYLLLLGIAWFLFAKRSDSTKFVLLIWAGFAGFFSVFWVAGERYFLPLIPLFFIYAWFGVESILKKIPDLIAKLRPENANKILLAFLIIFVLISMPQTFGKFLDYNSGNPYVDDARSKSILKMADIINNYTEPDAIVMGCHAEELHFYTDRKFVQMPFATPTGILELIDFYNVTYITLNNCDRRFKPMSLEPFYNLLGFSKTAGIEYNLYKFVQRESIIEGRPALFVFPEVVYSEINASSVPVESNSFK